jgi:hypothetical protein
VREFRLLGSVRGARSNARPYRHTRPFSQPDRAEICSSGRNGLRRRAKPRGRSWEAPFSRRIPKLYGESRLKKILGATVLCVLSVFATALPSPAQQTPANMVSITGVVCQAQARRFTDSKQQPDIFIDFVNNVSPKAAYEYLKVTSNSFTANVSLTQGFHEVFLVSEFGGANVPIQVLQGHPRSVTVSICNALTHYDTWRSISVQLPTPGLRVKLITSLNGEEHNIAMSIDDGVAYATTLPGGQLILAVSYSSGMPTCNFMLPRDKDEQHQHILVNLKMENLVSVGASIPGHCTSPTILDSK